MSVFNKELLTYLLTWNVMAAYRQVDDFSHMLADRLYTGIS